MGRGMKAGKKPRTRSGSGNMQQQLQQVQAMQRQMEEMQSELESKEFSAAVGGGAVEVKANGSKEILAINIDRDVIDPEDKDMLEDLVVAAVNEVLRQVDEVSSNEMNKLTGGLNIPGLM